MGRCSRNPQHAWIFQALTDVFQYEQTHNMMQVWTGKLSELQLPTDGQGETSIPQWHAQGCTGQLTTHLECTGVNFNTAHVLILNCALAHTYIYAYIHICMSMSMSLLTSITLSFFILQHDCITMLRRRAYNISIHQIRLPSKSWISRHFAYE